MALPTISNWKGKLALVTGGSVGIGKAICKTLACAGLIVIGCARKKERMDEVATECNSLSTMSTCQGKVISYACDVTKDDEIDVMFKWIESNFGGVDVCINNCGITLKESLLELSPQQMREMLDVNVVAASYCANKAFGSMRKRDVYGHIININSYLGKHVMPILSFYTGTKFALTALTESLRMEIARHKLQIRVTGIYPGLVETDFRVRGWGKEAVKQLYESEPSLSPQDVADAVLYALSTPLNVQIEDITLQPMTCRQSNC